MVITLLASVIVLDQAAKWLAWRHVSGAEINPGGDVFTGRTIGGWYSGPVTGAVVSYDMPWNPQRVVQRNGRVIRLLSPHDQVQLTTMLPTAGDLDELLHVSNGVYIRGSRMWGAGTGCPFSHSRARLGRARTGGHQRAGLGGS